VLVWRVICAVARNADCQEGLLHLIWTT